MPNQFSADELAQINADLKEKQPTDVIQWALAQSDKAMVSTNFRPYEASILHACTQVKNDLSVIWCDTGYNTRDTYQCADKIINQLTLNIFYYSPIQTSAYLEYKIGGIPMPEDDSHAEFTERVKLEPFRRALAEHNPAVWFTNLRKGQTAFRDGLDIVTQDANGCLKVSPFFYWSDEQLDEYMKTHDLPNEFNYFDPTKADEKRECGLHTHLAGKE